MNRRPGMSLTEVLVALFILTLGVIGILTMFPLGAAQMARAVRDDRSALAATNADAYMRWYWQTYVVNPYVLNTPATQDAFLTATSPQSLFDTPQVLATASPINTTVFGNNVFPPNNTAPVSYAVFVDPMGFQARQWVVGDTPNYALIPRYYLSGVQNQYQSYAPQAQTQVYNYRNCSLMDSLGFNENGTPTPDLELRYNWLWVLQRPQSNPNPLASVNMTVVVFDRRSFLYPLSGIPGFETVLSPVPLTSGSTTVPISSTNNPNFQQALDLKPGSWVMDATVMPAQLPNFPLGINQANFYRVVSVVPVNGGVTLELQSPIIPPVGYAANQQYPGTLIALSGVSGVFARSPLTSSP